MNQFQQTIKQPVTISGVGLHSGKECFLELLPSAPGTGITFLKTNEGVQIPATIRYVESTNRSTSIGVNGIVIRTVEHLMAALYGLQIDNLLIKLTGEEIPILDGSSERFVRDILKAGLEIQSKPREFIEITEPSYFESSLGSQFWVSPSKTLRIEVELEYPDNHLLDGTSFILSDLSNFSTEAAAARTYCFEHEVYKLLEYGLIRGGSYDNALVIGPGSNPLEWRYPNEPARHKLLDLLGDLALAGKPIKGYIRAKKPGHLSNFEFGHFLLATFAKTGEPVT